MFQCSSLVFQIIVNAARLMMPVARGAIQIGWAGEMNLPNS